MLSEKIQEHAQEETKRCECVDQKRISSQKQPQNKFENTERDNFAGIMFVIISYFHKETSGEEVTARVADGEGIFIHN